jgi:pyruvate,orthophosphate dikinase
MKTPDFAPAFIGLDAEQKPLSANHVGSKASELARMSALRLPAPPAFVLPTSLCDGVCADESRALDALRHGLAQGIDRLESASGKKLGDARDPLFVSVRSGAAKSMPGMLDTVLNVGMNGASVHGLIRATGNPRLAYDSYRRFIESYVDVVGERPLAPFEDALARMIHAEGAAHENELDPEALERLVGDYLDIASAEGAAPPEEPMRQLIAAARAVYLSWRSPRAEKYRHLNSIDHLLGTAVTVQAMVFGNSGGDSGSGVAFSRDPSTGAKGLYVDFLSDAQGEDVVSGRRTPADAERLASRLPQAARQLAEGAASLEKAGADAQDIEFTVERGKLYFLQTRAAKRTPRAALKIAVDLVAEGLIDRDEALRRIADVDLEKAGAATFVQPAPKVAEAISAAPGVACGRACFTNAQAEESSRGGDKVILVRRDTSTEDIAGFALAEGILTAFGGRTSHAAVVARQMGKACLVGCRTLRIESDERGATLGEQRIHAGDWIALDGATGEITLGRRDIVRAPPPEAETIARWRAESAAAPAPLHQS